jgi:tRNA (Thr-GGU) A37 N-methylase
MSIQFNPIAIVRNTRTETGDDFWGSTISEIGLSDAIPEEAFEGIEAFSHLGVIYYFHRGRVIVVRWLDAIDGTPVLDIKPVFREFGPASDVRQPEWVGELMRDYWK